MNKRPLLLLLPLHVGLALLHRAVDHPIARQAGERENPAGPNRHPGVPPRNAARDGAFPPGPCAAFSRFPVPALGLSFGSGGPLASI